MRRLGKILHLSKSRSLIVRLESSTFVKLGTKVYDSRLKEIGWVSDIFGPVSAPYVALRPTALTPTSLVGRVVYSSEA